MTCRVCQSGKVAKTVSVREMMYGTREAFDYHLCADCGSLSIGEVPDDLSRYYPADYYSQIEDGDLPRGGLKAMVGRCRDRHALGLFSPFGAAMSWIRPALPEISMIGGQRRRRDTPIIDIGCGGAAIFLRRLARAGFIDLTGIDPFIDCDRIDHGPVKVLRATIAEVEGPYEVVTLNHSFEHLADPRAAMVEIRRILAPNGTCVVRIPTPSSEAFDTYGADWVQLDAPRHLSLPSRQGMTLLAESVGLSVERVVDDSTAFQFWVSELYRRDIPLRTPEAGEAVAEMDVARFARQAEAANRRGRGDQAAFVLRG